MQCYATVSLLEAVGDVKVVGRHYTLQFRREKSFGHRRIWLDYCCLISGGHRGDSAIPGRLYSLERRRQVPFVYPFHVHFVTLLVPFSSHHTCFLFFCL